MDGRDVVLTFDLFYNHEWSKIYKAISEKDDSLLKNDVYMKHINAKLLGLLHEGYKVLYFLDEEYPEKIRSTVYRPPFIIYYKGDIKDVEEKFFNKHYDPELGCFLD